MVDQKSPVDKLMADKYTLGMLVGFAVTVLSLFFAWASVKYLTFSSSITGMDVDDGKLVLIAALVAVGATLATVFSPENERVARFVALGAGALALLFQVINLFDLLGTDGVSLGFGLILGTVASAGALFAGVKKLKG